VLDLLRYIFFLPLGERGQGRVGTLFDTSLHPLLFYIPDEKPFRDRLIFRQYLPPPVYLIRLRL